MERKSIEKNTSLEKSDTTKVNPEILPSKMFLVHHFGFCLLTISDGNVKMKYWIVEFA